MEKILSSQNDSRWNARLKGVVLAAAVILFVGLGCSTVYRATFSKTHRSDFTVYTAAANAVLDGTNLYEAHNIRGWYYMYLPVFAVVMIPFALVDPFMAILLWYLLSIVMVVHGIHLTVKMVQRVVPDTRLTSFWLATLTVVGIAKPLLSGVSRGQTSVLVMYLCILGIWEHFEGKHWRSGFFLAGAIALKLFPALIPAYLLLKKRIATAVTTTIWMLLLVLVLPSGIFGVQGNLSLLKQWGRTIILPAGISSKEHSGNIRHDQMIDPRNDRNQSVKGVVTRLVIGKSITRPISESQPLIRMSVIVSILALAVVVALACLRWTAEVARPVAVFQLCVVVIAMIIASPVSWSHYYVLMAPPFAVALGLMCAPSCPRQVRIWCGVCLLLYVFGSVLSLFSWANYFGALFWAAVSLLILFVRLAWKPPAVLGSAVGTRPDVVEVNPL